MDDDLVRLAPLSISDPHRETDSVYDLDASNFEPADDVDLAYLPRADGGKDAWLFLAACFVLEMMIWGFPFTFGVWQDHYSQNPPFQGHANIPVIGSCMMGVMYLGAPFIFAGLTRWPGSRRPCTYIGIVLICTALATASFATEVWHLIVTQGVLYSIGGGLAYNPLILFVNEWFVQKKGQAFGIMWAATSVAGVVLPLVMTSLLSKFGFRNTLRIWAVVVAALSIPLLSMVKPRIPVSTFRSRNYSARRRLFDLGFLGTSYFLILQTSNIVESLGYFLPSIYLPMYAQNALQSSTLAGAFTVIAINGASAISTVGMGFMIDKLHVTTCMFLSTAGTTLCIFLLWGLGTSVPVLYLFAITYGLTAGGWCSIWTGMIRDIQKKTGGKADAGLVFATLSFGRGIGNMVSGPMSVLLIGGNTGMLWKESRAGFEGGYSPLIIFTGVSAFLGGFSFVLKRLGWM